MYHTFIFHKKAGNEVWSSGVSEPENEVLENEEIGEIESEDFYYNETQLFEDAHFYPSIKGFQGYSKYIRISLFREKNESLVPCHKNRIGKFSWPFDSNGPCPERRPAKLLVQRSFATHSNFCSNNVWRRIYHILRCLHFHDNVEIVNHPLVKIKSVIGHVQSKFSAVLTPGKNLCIDESLLLWKGRLRFKQYIPLKRNRFGIKLYMIVDCETGFVLGFAVYTGADTDYQKFDLGVTDDIVAHFLQPYFYKGYVVYIDNWYTIHLPLWQNFYMIVIQVCVAR